MLHYDLVLVFVAFQRSCVYLSLVKELAGKFRIAIVPQELGDKAYTRIKNTNNEFLKLCESYGADIVYDKCISTKIEILPQSNYKEETITNLNRNIKSRKTFWLAGVAMGNAFYDCLYGKKIDSILVVDKKFYNYRVEKYENNNIIFSNDNIIEIGVPYKKYPVFLSLGIDYIWANPTPFSFCNVRDRLDYLGNVFSLLQNISENDVIVLKPHNADERVDYIVNEKIYFLIKKLPSKIYPVIDFFAKNIANRIPVGYITDFFLNISIAIMYVKIMKRVKPLSEITKYHNFNLELFLPAVRKGLITGRSNSLWHGLFLKKPTYNCIDKEKKYFSDTKMHKYSMEYLAVHGNYCSLTFDGDMCNIIEDKTREMDFIEIISENLEEENRAKM